MPCHFPPLEPTHSTRFSFTENFAKVCTILADTTNIVREKRSNALAGSYYGISYEVVLLFGLTELKAEIAWKEDVSCIAVLKHNSSLTFAHQGYRKAVRTLLLTRFSD
jgi:hypothetical protein